MLSFRYDGSFDGFLCVIFEVYHRRKAVQEIQRPEHYQQGLFSDAVTVVTDAGNADRVWVGLGKKLTIEACKNIYQTFLSEQPGVEMLLYRYIRLVLDSKECMEQNFANPDVLEVIQLGRKVWREKHRMEAFVRFQKMADGVFLSVIAPDYNVLPLISRHFEQRYADQQWIIYDSKRHTGLHYNLQTVQQVQLETSLIKHGTLAVPATLLDQSENNFQQLWQQYFHSVNIPERKNPKLHLRHIPKRYWRYLSEKQTGV